MTETKDLSKLTPTAAPVKKTTKVTVDFGPFNRSRRLCSDKSCRAKLKGGHVIKNGRLYCLSCGSK